MSINVLGQWEALNMAHRCPICDWVCHGATSDELKNMRWWERLLFFIRH